MAQSGCFSCLTTLHVTVLTDTFYNTRFHKVEMGDSPGKCPSVILHWRHSWSYTSFTCVFVKLLSVSDSLCSVVCSTAEAVLQEMDNITSIRQNREVERLRMWTGETEEVSAVGSPPSDTVRWTQAMALRFSSFRKTWTCIPGWSGGNPCVGALSTCPRTTKPWARPTRKRRRKGQKVHFL